MNHPSAGGKSATPAPTATTGYLNRTANQPILGVKRPLWRNDDDHSKILGEEYQSLRTMILQRDNYSCRFCGFKSAKYKQFHHLDNDHDNCTKENVITACNLCHQVSHLAGCAMANRGFFCSLQELTQTEINNIARAIYVNQILGNKDVCDKLISLIASFNFRGSDTLKTIFGADIVTPMVIAQLLADPHTISDEKYANRAEMIGPLKLFPTINAFQDGQLEYYALNNRAQFLPENWSALTRQLLM